MDIVSVIVFLVVGALAGWLAGQIKKGRGFGAVGNIVVGVVGAILGGVVFSLVGITASNILGSLIIATIGAVLLLYIINMINKSS